LAATVNKTVPTNAPKSSDAPSLAVVLPATSVRRVWETLFAAPEFWKRLFDHLGYSSFVATPWSAPNACKACVERVVKFVVPLSHSVGPSSTRMTSTQTARMSEGGKRLVIFVATQCHDTPSADAFFVQTLIVVDEQGADCVMRARWSVKFVKSVFLIKGLIESTALRDNHTFYRALAHNALAALAAPARTSATATAAATDTAAAAAGATTNDATASAATTPATSASSPLRNLATMISRRLPASVAADIGLADTRDATSSSDSAPTPSSASNALFSSWIYLGGTLLALVVAVCAVLIAHAARNAAADAMRNAELNRDLLLRVDARLDEYRDVLLAALRRPDVADAATLVARLETLGVVLNDLAWRARTPPSSARQRAELELASALLTARVAVNGGESSALPADHDVAVTAEAALREAALLVDNPASPWTKMFWVLACGSSAFLAIMMSRWIE
jgi:hypothetical protein